jgi:hypothetical protein
MLLAVVVVVVMEMLMIEVDPAVAAVVAVTPEKPI